MRPIVLTKKLAAASANNIATSQTPTSGTALTLNGTLVSGGVATLDTPRRVLLTYGNEASGRTLVLSGTNGLGLTISETLVVPSGASGTVASLQDFATVTSAVPAGGGWTAAITLGTNATGSTIWVVPNYQQQVQNIGVECELLSGTATWQIDTTQNDPRLPISIYQPGYLTPAPVPTPFQPSGLNNLSQSTQGVITTPIMGMRLTIVSGTGLVRATFLPAGLRD